MKGFRDEFKHFKRKDVPPEYHRVIDFNRINASNNFHKNDVMLVKCGKSKVDWERNFGMKNPSEWEVYTFLNKLGLIFIKNPFNTSGQRYWIIRCLEYYTRRPSKLNIDAHDIIKTNENWWEFCHRQDNKEAASALEKLRWATFGYHHNWDTKVYSESSKCEFPNDLKVLCSFIAQEINFLDFNAEAAIINMYHFGSSLSGHTDHSEVNATAPLFSFSFGQSAVFLIGGRSIEDPAVPILVESGDIIIMSGESRLCYHGVPRILPAQRQPWIVDVEKWNTDCNSDYYLKEVLDKLWKNEVWRCFEEYVKKSRINMNVRQNYDLGMLTLSVKTIWHINIKRVLFLTSQNRTNNSQTFQLRNFPHSRMCVHYRPRDYSILLTIFGQTILKIDLK